jgi:hypothetical protein
MPFYHFLFVEDGRVVIDENYESAGDGAALRLAQSWWNGAIVKVRKSGLANGA